MKRLSISLPAVALALALVLSGATTTHYAAAALNAARSHKEAGTPNTAAATPANATKDIAYYWYTYPGDSFVDHQTVNTEEWEYLIWFGWNVNTNSGGGT